MLIAAVCFAAFVGTTDPPPVAAVTVSADQQETVKKKKKDTGEKAEAGDEQEPGSQEKKEKKPKKTKEDAAAKKAKKAKKNALADSEVSPDEPVDPDADGNNVGWSFSWRQHPGVRYNDWLRIDLEAKLQEDGRWVYGPVKDFSTWQFHRNRFGLKGYITKHIEYEIEHEFTEQELTDNDIEAGITPKSQWKDVYLNFTYMRKAQIQVGKFKVPFGLDELTGVTHNDFIYRSLGANYLAPGRDIGVQVHGSFWKHGFEYATGVFEHDGDNAKSKKIQGGDATWAGRVSVTPLRKLTASPIGSLDVGTSYAYTKVSDDPARPNGLRGRTVVTQDTFYENVYVKGYRRRWEADVDWTVGPAAVRGEYTWQSDDRVAQGIGDEDLPNARGRAWYVTGTWILTGEDKRRPVKAADPFAQGGIGAIELAGRYERLWYDSSPVSPDDPLLRNPRAVNIFPSGDKVLTLGINWTLNRFVKIQFNGIREQVEDIQRNPVPNGAAFWSKVLRFQFVL